MDRETIQLHIENLIDDLGLSLTDSKITNLTVTILSLKDEADLSVDEINEILDESMRAWIKRDEQWNDFTTELSNIVYSLFSDDDYVDLDDE